MVLPVLNSQAPRSTAPQGFCHIRPSAVPAHAARQLLRCIAAALLGATLAIANNLHAFTHSFQEAYSLYQNKQYHRAIPILQEVAMNLGDHQAEFLLGWIYSNGEGTTIDYFEAARWYTFAANAGDATAMNNLSALYSQGGAGLEKNERLAFQWLKRAAEKKDPRALANIAERYRLGAGIEADQFSAFAAANESRQLGDLKGKFLVATYLLEGVGTKKNAPQAEEMLRSVVSQNIDASSPDIGLVANAAIILGDMYFNGAGVPKNVQEAYGWYLQASAVGGPESEEAAKRATECQQYLSPEEQIAIQGRVRDRGTGKVSEPDLYDMIVGAVLRGDFAAAKRLAGNIRDRKDPRYLWVEGKLQTEASSSASQPTREDLFRTSCEGSFWYGCLDYASVLAAKGDAKTASYIALQIDRYTPQSEIAHAMQARLLINLELFTQADLKIKELSQNREYSGTAAILQQELSDKIAARRKSEAEQHKKDAQVWRNLIPGAFK